MAVYEIDGAVIQDATDNLYWAVCCKQDGEPETDASACTVTLYLLNGDGTRSAVSGQTETVNAPTADGVFNGKLTPDLTVGKLYSLHVSLTADTSARTGSIFLGIPPRAS